MKAHATCAIIGGGIYGVSLAYWLAEMGWRDVVLLEKGELTSGQTWHAAGFVTNYAFDITTMQINNESMNLYKGLESDTGQDPGWITSGTLRLIYNQMQMDQAKTGVAWAEQVGVRAEIVSPERAQELMPFLDASRIIGAIYTPDDGSVDPARLTQAIAVGARKRGAEINRHTRVTGLEKLPDGRWRVQTSKGDLVADHVVNAAGFFAREVGEMAGVNVPVGIMQHQYIITEAIPEIIEFMKERELPTLRDFHAAMYMRREQQGICIGCYETEGALFYAPEGMRWDFDTELLPNNIEPVLPWYEKAAETVPIFASAGIKTIINGPQIFSATGATFMGRAAGHDNYWLCCGSSTGITQGGGSAKMLAQYMTNGIADVSMAQFDPANIGRYADRDFTLQRVKRYFERVFEFHAPYEEPHGARPAFMDPLYERQNEAGASFGEAFGWERANWFAPEGVSREDEQSYRQANFHTNVGEECQAIASAAGLVNLSAFAKIEVSGSGAHAFLDGLIARKLPQEPGKVTLGHYLNDAGRVVAEHTITRRKNDSFYLVFASRAQERDLGMLQLTLPKDGSVSLQDVRHDFGVLLLSGPKSRDILGQLTPADLSSTAFPWLTAQEIEVAGIPLLAMRVSYAGELGWELHVSMDHLAELYDALKAAGAAFGLKDVGIRALNCLRLEKAYRGFGSELNERYTLDQAGMAFFASNKATYRGKDAVLAERTNGGQNPKLVYLQVENADNDAWGDEPVYAEGKLVGAVTSGGFGFRVNHSIAFAMIEPEYCAPGTKFQIKMLGQMRKAVVCNEALYDPQNIRLKA